MILYRKTARTNNSNTLLVDIGSYLRNQRSKQANLVDLQFLSNCALFSKDWCRSLLKKEPRIESILCNSNKRHPENFKIKLYCFQEKLSLGYNVTLKLLSLFHICMN